MGPLATVLCAGFVAYLYWRDFHKSDRDRISWAPFAWMFIAGTRFVSSWLHLGAPEGGVEAYAEGSPLDRAVFFALIVWGVIVLARRNINWRQLLANNKWLTAYFVYCLLSMAWTDEPMILAKRWLKDLGNPVMALVLLTEARPYEAIATTVRRLAYFAAPVSVLFIRYYPEFGRAYAYGGGTMYSGVADNKNTLGMLCLIGCMCYAWTHLFKRGLAKYDVAIGAILVWLLYEADSKTSVTCAVIAIAILVVSKRSVIERQPTRIVAVTVAGMLAYIAADWLFQVKYYALAMLGRDATLTNRTQLWAVVRGLQTNALVGTGFMSFWAGDRMTAVWKALGPGVNQAHNGYLEQYLNLGYVGVGFIIAIALSTLFVLVKQLKSDYTVGVLRLCIVITAMLYNYTEASFYGISLMWVLFLAGCINAPQPQLLPSTATGSPIRRANRRARVLTNQTPAHVHPSFGQEIRQPGRARPAASSWTNRHSRIR
jgi:exopolysaccharide production protein ExoQ